MTTESVDKYAFKIIERIVDNITFDDKQPNHQSEDFLIQRQKEKIEETHKACYFVQNEDDYKIKNINWPKISDFNEKVAVEKIDEFIKNTWEFDECWLYCIDFVEKTEKEFNTVYNFRARWSMPTRRKPIPRFTASVYFTYDVSKIKPKDKPVDVYYIFEAQKLIHKPGFSRFRQEWLIDIINLKENLISDCKF